MARNKHPEETVGRILDVAMRLFAEKGFEHTTIQDIVDNLNVTKGAVYHHFKSKEDILDAAIERESAPLMKELVAIRDDPRMTGLEKMQALFEASMDGPQLPLSAEVAVEPDPVKNSRFLGMQYRSIIEEVAPGFVEPIIRQGMEDNTIRTEHPREMAEVVLILANLWVSPMFRMTDADQLRRRMDYYVELLHLMGLNVKPGRITGMLEDFRSGYEQKLQERGGRA